LTLVYLYSPRFHSSFQTQFQNPILKFILHLLYRVRLYDCKEGFSFHLAELPGVFLGLSRVFHLRLFWFWLFLVVSCKKSIQIHIKLRLNNSILTYEQKWFSGVLNSYKNKYHEIINWFKKHVGSQHLFSCSCFQYFEWLH